MFWSTKAKAHALKPVHLKYFLCRLINFADDVVFRVVNVMDWMFIEENAFTEGLHKKSSYDNQLKLKIIIYYQQALLYLIACFIKTFSEMDALLAIEHKMQEMLNELWEAFHGRTHVLKCIYTPPQIIKYPNFSLQTYFGLVANRVYVK